MPTIGDEVSGTTRPIDLKLGEGLDEATHFMVFPDGWIGHAFNYFGPRFEMLSRFLLTTSYGNLNLQFRSAIKKDLFETLNKNTLVALTIKAPASAFSDFKTSKDIAGLGGDLHHISEANQADVIELTLSKVQPKSTGHLLSTPIEGVKDIARKLVQLPKTNLEASLLTGDKEQRRVDQIDLLCERVVYEEQVEHESEKSRSITHESAFGAIVKAHAIHASRKGINLL